MHGFKTEHPLLLQETNNTVVWLRPHAIVAKVGKWRHSRQSLIREHAVATALVVDEAPIAPPARDVEPTLDQHSGFMVTLWERLEPANFEVTPNQIGESLRQLHEALAHYAGELPSFKVGLDLARATLADDERMAALRPDDRALLREEFDWLRERVEERHYTEQALHGEAHDRNTLNTTTGLRWIDLEGVCLGPLEWDLAFLPREAVAVFPQVDAQLLALVRTLNSARVAIWCWAGWEFAELRWHAEHHLKLVRNARRNRTKGT